MKFNKNTIKRIWASKGGAVVMSILYMFIISLLSFLNYDFYKMSPVLQLLFAPASLFTGITPSNYLVLGMPSNILFLSMVMYATIGYLIDWFIDPYE